MAGVVTKDSAVSRSVKTLVQTVVGLAIGLAVTVWAVPGVPDAVAHYALNNFIPVALAIGVPSGLTSLIYNLLRKDVPNL